LLVSGAGMETFGMALQEGGAHGLPILAMDGGYSRHHFTDGENGLLFKSTDGLARALVTLVRDESMMRGLFDRAQRSPREASSWKDAAETLVEYLARRGFAVPSAVP
jgi:glycosyltransferase involved in cell wall biosynthesis